ncbi:MAG: DUF87 domain-containing protein, partial [Myxococcota bacterium]|nr:DUF87 domain-containing protein [Myxococcota bacterium]
MELADRDLDVEGLGVFYLGRHLEEGGAVAGTPFLYDARDLTTHAVILGMTGSGKTGLGVSLLEEAALDGVPALVIDPKGDLANLRLAFPELDADSFAPWIDPEEASREGRTTEAHARAVAERWRRGLAEWGQGPERVARFREAAACTLYTPGSAAGRPLRVLRSLAAPSAALRDDRDALRERVQTTVSGLLALLGVEADPIRSREHILLARILEEVWAGGRDLDLPELIRAVQSPPFARVGVFDLEAFFPADARAELAMTLNNLLAAPGFAAWMEGEPLDVARLLHTPEGRPRLAVLSIAHLSEAERMFFVTLLLNEVVGWMRARPGTSSLRAILYMDEVAGYLPPTAMPPSKTPMLTLLKQARAYGLGVVLATQNPVDLDYKALSNAGTWFLGRLQTERDKARVVEGLEGARALAGGGFDRARLERLLAGLRSRVFLVSNAHEDAPQLVHTRWALSYLRGPLTREQIRRLEHGDDAEAPAPGTHDEAPGPAAPGLAAPAASAGEARPVLPAALPERFAAARVPRPAGARALYRPALRAVARLHYARASLDLDAWQSVALLAPLHDDGPAWEEARELPADAPPFDEVPLEEAAFAPPPPGALGDGEPSALAKRLAARLYRERPLVVRRCRRPRLVSTPGESEGAFRVRLREALHEERDRAVEALRKRYAPKAARLEERERRALARVEREEDQVRGTALQAAISFGATVAGALLGRRLASARNVGRATTTARAAGRVADAREDVARAEAEVEAVREAR